MKNSIINTVGVQTMSSKEIAELTGKQHAHILRDIRIMLHELDDPKMDHADSYRIIHDNRDYVSEILLNKELTLTLVSGYNVKLRNAIIKRWQELEAQQVRRISPYYQRIGLNAHKIPVGYFSAITELDAYLVSKLEHAGWIMPNHVYPDISVSKMFNPWLRKVHHIDTSKFQKYTHSYPDGRKVQANLYPNKLLPLFREHLETIWIPERAYTYFEERCVEALPYLPKAFPMQLGYVQ